MKIGKRLFLLMLLPTLVPVWANSARAAIVRDIPGLTSITFYETTSTVRTHTFLLDSPQLTTQLASLGSGRYDFFGVAGQEYYDVFYSDADGTFNANGEFITVEAVYGIELPYGGGLNIARIGLNFADNTSVYAKSVVSFVALGDNADPGSVDNAVDGDLSTYTSMGNTFGLTERLRITVNPVPLPAALPLLSFGLAGLVLMRSRSRRFDRN